MPIEGEDRYRNRYCRGRVNQSEATMTAMRKARKAALRLRKGAGDKEIIRWAKTHDVFDRLDAGVSELVDDHGDLDRYSKGWCFKTTQPSSTCAFPRL